MDKEKLTEAAKHFAAWETINSRDPNNNYYCKLGFVKGAQWLLSQPLADRLTDKEKEEIIKRYNDELEMARLHTEKMKESNNPSSRQFHANVRDGYISRIKLLQQIFGNNLFNEKQS